MAPGVMLRKGGGLVDTVPTVPGKQNLVKEYKQINTKIQARSGRNNEREAHHRTPMPSPAPIKRHYVQNRLKHFLYSVLIPKQGMPVSRQQDWHTVQGTAPPNVPKAMVHHRKNLLGWLQTVLPTLCTW